MLSTRFRSSFCGALQGLSPPSVRCLVSPSDPQPARPHLGGAVLWSLLERVPEPVWLHTQDGRFLEVNQAACERYGYSREAFLQLHLSDLLAPDDPTRLPAWLRDTAAQGQGQLRCRHLRKDRTGFQAEVSASAVGSPQGPLILATIHPAVARLNGKGPGAPASTLSNDSPQHGTPTPTAHHLAAVLDQFPEPVALIQADTGLLCHVNAAFAQRFTPSGQLPGTEHLLDRLCEVGQGQTLPAALVQARVGLPWAGALSLKGPLGAYTTYDGVLGPVTPAGGDPDMLILRLRDTTQEAERERQLREAQRLSALGALAGGVAHDFNNLIGAILGAAELMELHVEPHGPLWKKVGIIRQVCGRARELTRQILTFGRRSDANWTPLDLTDLAVEVANLLKTTLPPNVTVRTDLSQGIRVLGDASQLHQVIMNLGINASQAMQPGGGRLSIRLKALEAGPVAPGQAPPDPKVCLSVEDSGCGMDPLTLEHIFEPFFTTKTAGQGTGLGLSVVHGIIEGHGGHLQVSSQPGQGSAFRIYLPQHQERRKGTSVITSRAAGCLDHP